MKRESSNSFHIPGIAAMELIVSARDKADLERIHTNDTCAASGGFSQIVVQRQRPNGG
jgi:hypothetical protein